MQTTSRQLVPETVHDADLYISGAKSARQTAKATFDFKGRSERELTVAKNEIVRPGLYVSIPSRQNWRSNGYLRFL